MGSQLFLTAERRWAERATPQSLSLENRARRAETPQACRCSTSRSWSSCRHPRAAPDFRMKSLSRWRAAALPSTFRAPGESHCSPLRGAGARRFRLIRSTAQRLHAAQLPEPTRAAGTEVKAGENSRLFKSPPPQVKGRGGDLKTLKATNNKTKISSKQKTKLQLP